MQELLDKWEGLKKALNHKEAIADPKIEEPADTSMPDPHPDHLDKVQYGYRNIPGHQGSPGLPGSLVDNKIGYVKLGGKGHVVRHGSAAQRTDVEHQMAKLLGADHMLPEQTYDHGLNHPKYHKKDKYDPHTHGGTSLQAHVAGDTLEDALEDPKLASKLQDQWKNGDLHKLWALHYISNNGDMHTGNFKVGKDGVKAFDSDHAFYELPQGHTAFAHPGQDKAELEYSPYSFSQLPSYLSPFVENNVGNQDDAIPNKFKDTQVAVKGLNEHAEKINPELFEQFGPHAAERAAKVKKALMSSDPTSELIKLWHNHEDKTGDLNFPREEKKAA